MSWCWNGLLGVRIDLAAQQELRPPESWLAGAFCCLTRESEATGGTRMPPVAPDLFIVVGLFIEESVHRISVHRPR